MSKRILSLVLALVLCLGLIPTPVLADLAQPYQSGEKELIFSYVTMSGAGAAQMNDWVSGEFLGVQEKLLEGGDYTQSDWLKTRLMIRAMRFESWDYEEPISFYIPANETGSTHELTLYAYEDVDPADISLDGVSPAGEIERHVYGDEDSEGDGSWLYWYTIPVFVPSNDVEMKIYVKSELFATLPLIHVSGHSPVALFTTMQVYDYVEGAEPETIRSMTLRISGFSLPGDPGRYSYAWQSDPEAEELEDQYTFTAASELSEPDTVGYRYLTFDFGGDVSSEGMIWGELSFLPYNGQEEYGYGAFFFGKKNHLTLNETTGKYSFTSNYGKTWNDIYYPYGHLGGYDASVPTPYYCIFKEPDLGEAPEVMPELMVLGTALPGGSVSTQLPDVSVSRDPGSYLDGEWRLSADGRNWSEWTTLRDDQNQIVLTIADSEKYGDYIVYAQFRKEGLKTIKLQQKVNYNDGRAPDPTKIGIINRATGSEVALRGNTSVIPVREGARYLFYAEAGEGLTVCYDFSGGTESHNGTMEWNAVEKRYEAELAIEDIPVDAESFRVWSSGESVGYSQNGTVLALPLLFWEVGALQALYAPTIPYEVKKDEAEKNYYAIAPGAALSGVFKASTGVGRSQQMRLTYLTTDGSEKTATVDATNDGNGQFTATLTLPDDADRLVGVRYELVLDGEIEDSAEYDLSNYRVYARSFLSGIPAEYAGAKLELNDGNTVRSYFVTADNYASISLGDLPSGGYAYTISGASGHICKGAFTLVRGGDVTLGGLPALGSVTVVTTGFTSGLTGQEVNPTAGVTLTLKTPDGTISKVQAGTGGRCEQIPIGSTGTAEINWDVSASDEIRACTAEDDSFTVAGDETLSFAYQPFTFRTISGYVGGLRTYSDGRVISLIPRPTLITLTQEINRGGRTETVTFTTQPDYSIRISGSRGGWSAVCYDDIPVKIEFRGFTWDTQTIEVTKNGNVNVGVTEMTYGGEMLIRVDTVMMTGRTLKEDGSEYFGNSTSVQSPIDSAFMNVSSVTIGENTYSPSSGKFETIIQNGQLYIKLASGIVVGSEGIFISGSGNYTADGVTVSVPRGSGAMVQEDEDGQPYVRFTAAYAGGEFRTTVVDADSEYVGFLLFRSGDSCIFTCGRGELFLRYDSYNADKTNAIAAFMVPEQDAEEMAEQLSSGGAKVIWDLLPTDGGWSSYFFNQQYRGQILHKQVRSYQNAVVYLEDMQPTAPLLTSVLPPYTFSYRYELTDSPNTVRLIGTLSKRYPDQVNQDNLRSETPNASAITLYTMESREQGSPLNATVPISVSDLGVGQYLITADLPLSYVLRARFKLSLTYWHNTVTDDRGFHTLDILHEDDVPIFSLTNPGDIYITDQLEAQGLSDKRAEVQATWYLNLSLRSFISENQAENQITIYDNGTPIYTYDVGNNGNAYYYRHGDTFRFRVRLTDNMQAGIHVLWANRLIDGETVSTEPVIFSLLEGRANNSVYISNFYWYHWNHRLSWDENQPDELYFANLSDLAGENIWIWPSKKHQMRFTVKNATSAELDGVNLVYTAYWARNNNHENKQDQAKWGYFRSEKSSGITGYNLVTRVIPCSLISENKGGNYSVWGIDEFYMGYLQSFEFEFDYNAAIDAEIAAMSEQALSDLETAAFYQTNGLGEVPDDLEQISAIEGMSADERIEALTSMSEASQAMQGLDLQITQDNASGMKMELMAPTNELSEYTVTLEKGGTMQLPAILMLMQTERENGNQNPDEQGWDVTWAEFETVQGATLLRIASFDGVDPATGRHALLTHTTYYVTKSVADALENGTALLAAATPGPDNGTPDHWTKQLYDGTSTVYSVSDMADEAWKAYCRTNHLKMNPGDLDGATSFADSESLIPKKLDATMKVLGVVDTVITYAKGPSGADPNGLRQLLTYVRDEKARNSLEAQIRDYEKLRYDIYQQDCAMSTYSCAANFAPMGPFGKVAVFLGGLANGIISGWSKDYNRQVYNTTLHDIQLQIKYEAVKAEHLKKSFIDAEQWLRNKMDSIYGKGAWSEYALAQERKNWVLKEYPGGILRYVWREKAPEFSVTLDPSGFVYEAVTEDVIEGVTATLYYSQTEEGPYSVWADPYNDQPNPQATSDTGNYMWMVPTGWWKVRYEKEGYQIAESIAMPVPPEHTTVNIGLLSTEAPTIRVVPGDGEITVLFSKYMQLESLIRLFGDETYTAESFDASSFAVQFYDANGVAIPGTVTFPDVRENTGYKGNDYGTDVIDSDWFVRYAVFTPDDQTVDISGVEWMLAEGMVSYAGVPLASETTSLHVLRLDSCGGQLNQRYLVTDESGQVALLPEPTRAGESCQFLGWFTAAEGGERRTVADTFTTDITLYAHWTKGEIQTLNCEGNTVTVTAVSLESATIWCAAYAETGQMLEVQSHSCSGETSAEFTFNTSEFAYVKAFLLDGDGTPLCENGDFKIVYYD